MLRISQPLVRSSARAVRASLPRSSTALSASVGCSFHAAAAQYAAASSAAAARAASASSSSQQRSVNPDGSIDFGFQQVPVSDKQKMVHGVFARVAQSYDVMNDAMSMGMHRVWKADLVRQIAPAPNVKHLDVAGGTGDIAFRVLMAANKEATPHFANSPSFSDESRYGSRGFVLSIQRLIKALAKHHKDIDGKQADIEFRVLGTFKYQQEWMHAILLCPKEVIQTCNRHAIGSRFTPQRLTLRCCSECLQGGFEAIPSVERRFACVAKLGKHGRAT